MHSSTPGRVLYYKKILTEIGDPQLAYSPCERRKNRKEREWETVRKEGEMEY